MGRSSVNEKHELLAAPYIPKGLRDESVTAYDYLQMLENEREANEAVRVLYVAATRAERKLHLVGTANQNAKGEINPIKKSYLDLRWPALSQQFKTMELPENSTETEDEIANFVPDLIRQKQLQIPAAFQLEGTAATLLSKPQSNQLLPQASLNLSADAGSLAHIYMEMIANEGLERWPASRMDIAFQSMLFWPMQRGHAKNEAEKQVPQIIAHSNKLSTVRKDHGY